jgi:hypothetical protein
MRNLWVATVVASMILAPNVAWSDPLTPGKPAGVHTAQFEGSTPIIIVGVAVVAAAIAVAASSGGSNGPTTSTSTSATTTTS